MSKTENYNCDQSQQRPVHVVQWFPEDFNKSYDLGLTVTSEPSRTLVKSHDDVTMTMLTNETPNAWHVTMTSPIPSNVTIISDSSGNDVTNVKLPFLEASPLSVIRRIRDNKRTNNKDDHVHIQQNGHSQWIGDVARGQPIAQQSYPPVMYKLQKAAPNGEKGFTLLPSKISPTSLRYPKSEERILRESRDFELDVPLGHSNHHVLQTTQLISAPRGTRLDPLPNSSLPDVYSEVPWRGDSGGSGGKSRAQSTSQNRMPPISNTDSQARTVPSQGSGKGVRDPSPFRLNDSKGTKYMTDDSEDIIKRKISEPLIFHPTEMDLNLELMRREEVFIQEQLELLKRKQDIISKEYKRAVREREQMETNRTNTDINTSQTDVPRDTDSGISVESHMSKDNMSSTDILKSDNGILKTPVMVGSNGSLPSANHIKHNLSNGYRSPSPTDTYIPTKTSVSPPPQVVKKQIHKSTAIPKPVVAKRTEYRSAEDLHYQSFEDVDDEIEEISPSVEGQHLHLERRNMGGKEVERRQEREQRIKKYNSAPTVHSDEPADEAEPVEPPMEKLKSPVKMSPKRQALANRRKRLAGKLNRNQSKESSPSGIGIPGTTNVSNRADPFPQDMRPFDNPREGMHKVMQQLTNTEWEVNMEGAQGVVRLARNHPDLLATEIHRVNMHLIDHSKNLRSQVARAAVLAFAELFKCLNGKIMEPDLEKIVALVIHKTGDMNRFIRGDANDAMERMIEAVQPQRSLNALFLEGSTHKNAVVRCAAARLVVYWLETVGVDKAVKLCAERLFSGAAQLLEEGYLDTRMHAKHIFYQLMSHPDFEWCANKYIPIKAMRRVQKTLDGIRKTGYR